MKSLRKGLLLGGVAVLLLAGAWGLYGSHVDAQSQATPPVQNKQNVAALQNQPHKSLIVYFTYSENIGDTSKMTPDAVTSASLHGTTKNKEGNMQVMVEELKKRTGADTYSIVVKNPYAAKFEDMRDKAREDIDQQRLLELKNPLPDLSQYDVIYFGTPIWHYTLPAPVSTFLKEADLSGKTIVPFGIHRGSGFGSNLNTIQSLQPKAKLTDGFTVDAQTDNQEVRQDFDNFLDQLLGK